MRALITGGAGFVGPHLASHLTDCGDEVVSLDLNSGPDLRDDAAWVEVVGDLRPDAVYHLAGWSDVGASWDHPVTTFEVNALGTVAVLEAARRASVGRVLVVSSADVYGIVGPDRLPLTEEQPAEPRSPYGASKQAAEIMALNYWRGHKLATITVRPFNHAGPGQGVGFAAPAFAARVAAAEHHGGVVRHGELDTRRDLTDVRDVVRAYRSLVEHGRPGEIYNVCSGREVSMRHLLHSLVALTGADIALEPDPDLLRPVDLPVLVGSYAKLAAATGWAPAIPLEDTLTAVLDDARRRIDTTDPRAG